MIRIHDVTLRDGSHACGHQIPVELVGEYCKLADDVGFDAIEVGHGNGLGASSLQIGQSMHTDEELLKAARAALTNTRLACLAIPGWATLEDLDKAFLAGADVFRIGCHCTEADTTKKHIQHCRSWQAARVEVQGVLMMAHMATPTKLEEQANKMIDYGAQAVVIMDSAGTMIARASVVPPASDGTVSGFHGHNNLGVAVWNAVRSAQVGFEIIDTSTLGIGAGAGNAPLAQTIAALQHDGHATTVDLHKAMVLSHQMHELWVGQHNFMLPEWSASSILSGMAGVFSGFKRPVRLAASEYKVPEHEIWAELGRRKVVAGQEDLVIEVAQQLKESLNAPDRRARPR